MNRNKEIYKVTIIGGAVNVILLLFKFVAGILGNSAAMIADAVHSLSDFVTDIIVILFVRISGKPKDKSHDYGHGKYETLAMTIIGLALLVVAVGILYNGVMKIVSWANGQQLAAPDLLALWAAILSIILKEVVYQYSIAKANQLNSPAVKANAWHHRSDALSSIGTAIGIGGAIFLGQRWTVLDPIASVIVGIFIFHVSIGMLRNGIGDLMEQSLPDDVEEEILQLASSIEGVDEPHDLRTRRIGNHYAIERQSFRGGRPADTALRRGHTCSGACRTEIRKNFSFLSSFCNLIPS